MRPPSRWNRPRYALARWARRLRIVAVGLGGICETLGVGLLVITCSILEAGLLCIRVMLELGLAFDRHWRKRQQAARDQRAAAALAADPANYGRRHHVVQ